MISYMLLKKKIIGDTKGLVEGKRYMFIIGKSKIRNGIFTIPKEAPYKWFMLGDNGVKYTPYASNILSGGVIRIDTRLSVGNETIIKEVADGEEYID